MNEEESDRSELADVTGLDLDALEALPDTVLHSALRRVLDEAANEQNHYAAFQNSM